jgi:hypothetical protein
MLKKISAIFQVETSLLRLRQGLILNMPTREEKFIFSWNTLEGRMIYLNTNVKVFLDGH